MWKERLTKSFFGVEWRATEKKLGAYTALAAVSD